MRQIVYAIHNFDAENDDEITFKIGEPIEVLERDEKYQDGWWQGRNVHGEVGLFPMNYISHEKPQLPCTRDSSSTCVSTQHEQQQSLEDKIDKAISQVSPKSSDFSAIPPDQWDTCHVAAWLDSVGLSFAAKTFIDQDITGDILLELTLDAVKELGIPTYGKRYKVMLAINNLKAQQEGSRNDDVHPPKPLSKNRASREADMRLRSPPSPVESDSSYPKGDAMSTDESHYLAVSADMSRPVSPQSMVSRSNTFNTVSSKKSISSTRSEERNPLPKSRKGSYASSSRKMSLKSVDSSDKDTFSSAPSTIASRNNDWMTDSSISNHSSIQSASVPGQASDNNSHKLSVASVEPATNQEVSQTPEHEGWLHKQSDKYKTWNKRWFVLKGFNLFYFKSPKDVRMKGIINLRGYKIVVDDSIHNTKYSFKAQHERERTFYFYTDTEESMRKWVSALMKTTISRDISTPVMSSNPVATVSLEVARKMRPRPPSMLMYKTQRPISASADFRMDRVQEEGDDEYGDDDDDYSDRVSGRSLHTRSAYSTVSSRGHRNDDMPPIPEMPRLPTTTTKKSLPSSDGSASHGHWGADEYIRWVNKHLPPERQVDDLSTAFRDGEVLIELLETISNKQVRRPPAPEGGGATSMHILDTLVAAFKFMGREGVVIDGQYTIKDVFGGDVEKIMVMLETIKTWASDLQQQQAFKQPSSSFNQSEIFAGVC